MVHLISKAVLVYFSERPIPGMSVSMSKMSSSRRIIWAVPIPEITLYLLNVLFKNNTIIT